MSKVYRRSYRVSVSVPRHNVYYYIIQAFVTRAHSVVIFNQGHWQSLGGQHGKGVDGLFEKMRFQTAFEGVKSG